MELIYLYIRKYGNIFRDEEFNFSSNYVATLKENHLTVEDNIRAIKNYYGENVNNVVMLLGKNGTGKSTLLDILGMNREDRSDDTYKRENKYRKIKHSYFMLYHLYDDYFAFEFVDDSFLKGEDKITNIDMQNEKVEGALYKLPMGTIFKLENGVFLYCGNIILQWRERREVKNKLEYAYITSDKYNYRINDKYRKYYADYMFERKYYLEEKSYEYLYKYMIYLKEIDNGLIQEKIISIQNIIEIDFYKYSRTREIEEYLQNRKKELDELFNLKSKIQVQMEEQLSKSVEKKEISNKKSLFLYTFCAEAIEYYFLEHFVGWSESLGVEINVDKTIPGIESIESFIESQTEDKNSFEKGLMNIMSFQEEYALLHYQIIKNTDVDGNINLKNVLEYTLNRVEIAAASAVDIYDREAVLKIITFLEELPEDYFTSKKSIIIKCDVDEPDEGVVNLLKWYDNYYKIRNDDNGSNSIYKIIAPGLSVMSEGQRVFLEIVSKCVSAMYRVNPDDSLVLLIDEPDRALHPELARRFLDILLKNINSCENRNIQIILTSHSPFIVTDILPENVYAIDIKDGVREIKSNNDTYSTNIYYLLMDSFMLDNTFGQHSYNKIEKIVRALNSKEEISNEQLWKIKEIINRIGEKTVKKKLLQLYNNRNNYKSTLATRLLNETDEEKIRKIKDILDSND